MKLPSNLATEANRAKAEKLADKFLAANDNTPPKGRAPVYRGKRPAISWAAKRDQFGAACLWLVARERLPADRIAANDNEPMSGGLVLRRNGVARGKTKRAANLGEHLSLPAVIPPLGEGVPVYCPPAGHSAIETKPQFEIGELPDTFRSWGSCSDAVADGAIFIGAESGLGQPRPRPSKGSAVPVDPVEFDEPPADVNHAIELVLSGAGVADIGRAFGAAGRYADRKGAEMLGKACAWAKLQAANNNFRVNVTNRVTLFS